MTGFDNVVYFGSTNIGAGTHELVAVDIESGSENRRRPAGDFANLTMASDRRWLLTNNINFSDELAGRHRPAGVWGWRAVTSPADGRSDDCQTRVARLRGPRGNRAVRAPSRVGAYLVVADASSGQPRTSTRSKRFSRRGRHRQRARAAEDAALKNAHVAVAATKAR